MELVNAKGDRAAVGTAASGLERHPERRFKVRLAFSFHICLRFWQSFHPTLLSSPLLYLKVHFDWLLMDGLTYRPHWRRIRKESYRGSDRM